MSSQISSQTSRIRTYEMQRLLYKSLLRDMKHDPILRMRTSWKLTSLPKTSSRTRLQTRCVLTNRSRGVLKEFRLSRQCLRELSLAGLLPGVQKSSW